MPRAVRWLDDESGFVEQLARGRKAEMRVAFKLLDAGFAVKLGELLLRDDVKQRGDYVDQADITVDAKHVLEVKSRGLRFSSAKDYPYPTAFICAAKRWEARHDLPLATVLVSEKTGAMLVVPSETRGEWEVEQVFDRHRGHPETCYAIRRERLLPLEWLIEKLRAAD